MGLCGGKSAPVTAESKLQKSQSTGLDKELLAAHKKEGSNYKLLLLGAGESGKSTLFKQMSIIYGKGFDDADRKTYVDVIHSNVLNAMRTLIEQSDALAGKVSVSLATDSRLAASKKLLAETKEVAVITEDMALHLAALWRDPGIQRTWEVRSMYQINDSAGYFLEKVLEIGKPGYTPSVQDVLRSRVRTSGISEKAFVINGDTFRMFDVGGQRNERRKWIHCFSDVTAVLFVAAMSEYDMVLFEDSETNRMQEALQLFDEICNNRWFKRTSIILMLNKRDLFQEKLRTVPLKKHFPDYEGDNSYNDGCLYIRGLFEGRKKDKQKQIYCHITCATDTDQMKIVLAAVKDIVLKQHLQDGGLLG